MRNCTKTVGWKPSVINFTLHAFPRLCELQKELFSGKYKISDYIKFTILEPKERKVVSTRFRDRVIQKSISDNYFYPMVTKSFIYDNGACLKDRGCEYIRDRMCAGLQKYFRISKTNKGCVLKIDIHDYFGSTSHDLVKETLARSVKDEWTYQFLCKIIDSFDQGPDPNIGMALGSQITQITQLAVLDKVDHFIKEVLRIKFYYRCMDDFILYHSDKKYLLECRDRIIEKLAEMGFAVSEKKTQIYKIDEGFKALGFKFRLTPTGKVIKTVDPKTIKRSKRIVRKQLYLVAAGYMTLDKLKQNQEGIISYFTSRVSKNKANKPFLYRSTNYWQIHRYKEWLMRIIKKSEDTINAEIQIRALKGEIFQLKAYVDKLLVRQQCDCPYITNDAFERINKYIESGCWNFYDVEAAYKAHWLDDKQFSTFERFLRPADY